MCAEPIYRFRCGMDKAPPTNGLHQGLQSREYRRLPSSRLDPRCRGGKKLSNIRLTPKSPWCSKADSCAAQYPATSTSLTVTTALSNVVGNTTTTLSKPGTTIVTDPIVLRFIAGWAFQSRRLACALAVGGRCAVMGGSLRSYLDGS